MSVRKAVILAAGLGTRLLPASKAQPKETFPLVDRPIIQYVVEEAVASGLDRIVIVTSAGKRAVEDHFDRSLQLEQTLRAKGDLDSLEQVQRVSELADIAYVRQHEQRGIADAVFTTRHWIGNEPFVLFFPDDVMVSDVPAAQQVINTFEAHGGSVLAVEEVPENEVQNYGIVGGESVADGVLRLDRLVEKPKPEEAPSNLAIVGRYVLTPEIFDIIPDVKPGKGGELQITDALALLMQRQPLFASRFQGRRYDTGRPLGLLKASVDLALARPDIGPELRAHLRTLDLAN